jgi:hypothetical protein
MAAGKNMYEQLWERMDRLYKAYKSVENYGPDEFRHCIGEMKGIAFAIQAFSSPFLQGEKDVSTLADARYQAALLGEPFPNTPGVAGYNPLPLGRDAKSLDALKAAKANLSEEALAGIRTGVAAGFSHSDLADIYKVPVSIIASIVQ